MKYLISYCNSEAINIYQNNKGTNLIRKIATFGGFFTLFCCLCQNYFALVIQLMLPGWVSMSYS